MVANRELAKVRNISQENIEAIDDLHDLLEKLIASYTLEIPYEEARDLVRSANMTLSNLWGFTYDSSYDTWTPRLEDKRFELTFAGRTFECPNTGERHTIKYEDCYECNLTGIGEGAVDIGRAGSYHRIIGNLEEIENDTEAARLG